MLVEYYIRELLKLVLSNINNKPKLTKLFDRLETQLRALETLGVPTEKCAAMLLPLVESCIPEDTLRAWQINSSYDVTFNSQTRLEKLLEFLKKEVENEERISMAVSGFEIPENKKRESQKEYNLPTAAALLNTKKTKDTKKIPKCVICKENHGLGKCERFLKMTVTERIQLLADKGYCYRCMKYGHISRRCKVNVQCEKCKKQHATLMCNQNEESQTLEMENQNIEQVNMSNNTYTEVFLQTFVVKLIGKEKSRLVRVVIDTGSQKSYIGKEAILDMDYLETGEENVIHSLFGGIQTQIVKHKCFKILLQDEQDTFRCNFDALDQDIICNNVLSVRIGPWTEELLRLGIKVHDEANMPIEVLIGADIAGKLFIGRRHDLKCGFIAQETKLGWTLMGKARCPSRYDINSSNSFIISTSYFCRANAINHLWSLDVLAIEDPIQTKNEKDKTIYIYNFFLNNVRRDLEGRYEVALLWIENHPPLPDNYNLAKQRLDNLMKKLQKDGYYGEYAKVLHEWCDEGIIEKIDEFVESNKDTHYLPHHHVIKLNSATTKLRPVFDASAKENNSPSLNQCLEKGINLIKLIPSLLNIFRMSKIGVIADIKKAFLQIKLRESGRDFLRFLWYDEKGNLETYRHVRVVFGVTCSRFLLAAVIEYHLTNVLSKCSKGKSEYTPKYIEKLVKSFYVDNCVTSVDSISELEVFIQESKAVMEDAKLELRAWEYTILDDTSKNTISSLLGLSWNINVDSLEVCVNKLSNIEYKKICKRVILSAANSIFDPIGFTLPVSLLPKLLLQKTWLLKLGWDDAVPKDLETSFRKWISNIL